MTRTPAHDFLHARYDALHDTPMQRKLRRLAPLPFAVVFLPWPGMTEADARAHFRLMKRMGFNAIKQTMETAAWPRARTLQLALEEGLNPYWCAEGGWQDITPALLRNLGLPANLPIDEAMAHPRMRAHQDALMAKRVARSYTAPDINGGEFQENGGLPANPVPGVFHETAGHTLHPGARPHFIAWLKRTYGSVAALKAAWNVHHVGISASAESWSTWADVRRGLADFPAREYRHLRDIMRFRSDLYLRDYVRAAMRHQHRVDPDEPFRGGGEMGLFLPFASRGLDMEHLADAMAEGGSFYPSIHLAWHFEEVDFEVARPVFMQAQLANDWAKGAWAATWESTGGPQYFSGGKAPFVEEVRNQTAGFTVDAGTITQLLLSYLAAGLKGVGLWTWNYRTAGWEAGEYALLDRSLQPTPRAERAGAIGRTAQRYRRELWEAHKEPLVGVLVDWENEAMWAAMAVGGRDHFKSMPVQARIGVSRALINANVPWEYVTLANLRAGLGPRYRAIYLPAILAMSAELQTRLHDFAAQGGRLVIDMPGAYLDDFGRVLPVGPGSLFERTFGVAIRDFGFADAINRPRRIGPVPLDGFTADIAPTRARIRARFEDNTPAITEAPCAKGTAVVIASQLSLSCRKPGNTAAEALLVRHALGPLRPPYTCPGALVYRLASPRADHYFFINDGPARSVRFRTALAYGAATDALTGDRVRLDRPLALEAHGGRWIRCAHKGTQP